MGDPDTCLTTLYVMVDECCPSQSPPEVHPGPRGALSRSEGSPSASWGSGPASAANGRAIATPTSPCVRLFPPSSIGARSLAGCAVTTRPHSGLPDLVDLGDGRHGLYEALDSSAMPTQDAKRRGAGWLPGLADLGWSNRLGWYEGFPLRMAVNPRGDHRFWLWLCQCQGSTVG